MATTDEVHSLAGDLDSIQVDPPRIRTLSLDKMFNRATHWRGSTVSRAIRGPSPPRRRVVYPLPLPLTHGGASPLSQLLELPELVPHVLKWFERPAELAVLARVNRSFCAIVRRALYEHIWIRPWEEHCHEKLVLLFGMLQHNVGLCKLVRSLDVRFFPLATRDTERYELDEQVQTAFGHMSNLTNLIWTRDKSLNPDLVKTICSLKHLRSLEISGHSYRYYDPTLLGDLPALEDLRVMMPDSAFRDALPGVIERLDARPSGGLRGLAIISRSSPLVDDAMLRRLAPHLRSLQRLTLWGCTRVTREGVYEILREAEYLEELSLDALPHSDLGDLSRCPSLPCLSTLSLSFPPPHRTPVHPHLTSEDLPVFPPLENLTALLLTLSGDRAFIPSDGIDHLSSQVDWSKLIRLSILNLFCGATALSQILQKATVLEELYISINGRNVIQECSELVGSSLRILHVNAPERWGPSVDDLTELARVMPKLQQLGSGNRVYEVSRRYTGEGEEREVELLKWSRTFTPGYFQVWRG